MTSAGRTRAIAIRGLHAGRHFPDRRARADEVAVAEDVVDAADGGPEFVVAQPGGRVGGLGAGVGVVPRLGREGVGGVGRVFEEIVLRKAVR